MPRSPKDNQEIRSSRRDEILAAATRVFALKGYGGAKISEVAAEAGLSHGLVYHYFPSKEAIFGAIAAKMMARVDADLRLDCDRALDRIVQSMSTHRARLDADLDESRIVLQATLDRSIPPDIELELRDHFEQLFKRVASWIERAQAEGDIDADVPTQELAAGMICLFRGMSLRVPGLKELPFPPPGPHTIARMLCLTPAGHRRAKELTAGTTDPTKSAEGRPKKKVTAKKQAARPRRAEDRPSGRAKRETSRRDRDVPDGG